MAAATTGSSTTLSTLDTNSQLELESNAEDTDTSSQATDTVDHDSNVPGDEVNTTYCVKTAFVVVDT